MTPWLLALVLRSAVPLTHAGPDGHHRHEAGFLPAAGELCSCGESRVRQSDCALKNSEGRCVLPAGRGGKCTAWHCHPGADEAHKARETPGKAVPLASLPETAPAAPAGAEACKPRLSAARFPFELKGPSPSEIPGCQEWAAGARVDYPAVDGKADCSRPAPTLVTRCTTVLDPAYRLRREAAKGQDCSCAEWTAVAHPTPEGAGGVSQTSSCTAYICRPMTGRAPAAAPAQAGFTRIPLEPGTAFRAAVDKGAVTVLPGAGEHAEYAVSFKRDRGPLARLGLTDGGEEGCAECAADYSAAAGLRVRTVDGVDAVVRLTVPVDRELAVDLAVGTLDIGPRSGKTAASVATGTLSFDGSALPAGACADAGVQVGAVENRRDSGCKTTPATLRVKTGTIAVR